MKYVTLLLLILIITACSQSNHTPKEEDFEVTVKVVDEELKTKEKSGRYNSKAAKSKVIMNERNYLRA